MAKHSYHFKAQPGRAYREMEVKDGIEILQEVPNHEDELLFFFPYDKIDGVRFITYECFACIERLKAIGVMDTTEIDGLKLNDLQFGTGYCDGAECQYSII